MKNNRGWHNESKRHALARKGISTKSSSNTPIRTPSQAPSYTVEYRYPMYVKLEFDNFPEKSFMKLRKCINSSVGEEYITFTDRCSLYSIEKQMNDYIIIRRNCNRMNNIVFIDLDYEIIDSADTLQMAQIKLREQTQLEINGVQHD